MTSQQVSIDGCKIIKRALIHYEEANMSSQGSKYALLPLYLVLDTSYSMQEGGKFSAALSFLPKLLSAMTESSSLNDKIRVEVLTFDEDARVDLLLGGLNEVELMFLMK